MAQPSASFSAEECGILPFMCCEAYFGWAEKLELLGGRPWDLPCGCGLAHHCEARDLPDQMQVGTARGTRAEIVVPSKRLT